MSGKHGRLSVGGKAFVFNDGHLPLSGDWFQSALGKSVVVHVPDGGGERMACANIEEERDIVKQVRRDSAFWSSCTVLYGMCSDCPLVTLVFYLV